ncbi:MAG TPA: hypothetical protein VFQ91_09310 [Bryobacteraceae bacterium]|nr:hypothetical protein [Bryobacteraceae bacterium]
MKRFQFSLQAALTIRERTVELAENAVRAVQNEWNHNQEKQRQLIEEVRTAELAVRQKNVDPADLAALDRYRVAAQRRRTRMAEEATLIGRRLAERRAVLQKAELDRTLLVRLREKALVRWQMEYEKEQQLLAEEAYLSRWGR